MPVRSWVVGEADQAPQAPTGARHGRRWPWLVLSLVWVLIVACATVPVVYVVAPAVLGTWTADHGKGSPRAASAAFVYSFNDGPDATGVDRLIASEQRSAIGGRRRTYLATMTAGHEDDWVVRGVRAGRRTRGGRRPARTEPGGGCGR